MKVKKILLTLGIVGLTLFGYSGANLIINAGECETGGGYTMCVDDKGNFSTVPYGHTLFYSMYGENYSKWGYFWKDGRLCNYYGANQGAFTSFGYVDKYCVTDYGNTCTNFTGIDLTIFELNNVIVDSINRVPYDFFENANVSGPLCFNLSSPNSTTYCFPGGNIRSGNGISNFNVIPTFDMNNVIPYFENSPWNSGGNGGETETGGVTNKPFCPPIKVYVDSYGENFTTNLCWSNPTELSGNEIVYTQMMNIFTAFTGYENFIASRQLLSQNCRTEHGNTQEECMQTIQAIGKKQTEILLNTIQSGLNPKRIYEYCRLETNYTQEEQRDIGICELTDEEKYAPGLNKNDDTGPNTTEQLSEWIDDIDEQLIIPEDGTIFDQILPDGIITWKDMFTNINFIKNIMQLFNKLFLLREIRPDVDGILPPVITSLLLLIVLFKIYKNKHDKSE